MTISHAPAYAAALGCAAKIAGRPLATSDNRRPQSGPHLRHSIELAEAVFDYLAEQRITVFRLPSNFCPYATHPDYPQLHWQRQFAACSQQLADLGQRARTQGLRLSFHPSQYVLLNSPRPEVVRNSVAELEWQSALLDALGQGPQARVLLHAGGVYGDRRSALERLRTQIERLPERVRARFALENDDVSWPVAELLAVCHDTATPLIFDVHHHRARNHGESVAEALAESLATWPTGVRAKVHLSSPRDRQAPPTSRAFRAHADYVELAHLRQLAEAVAGPPPFDIMLEAKAKDLAVLRLRDQLGVAKPDGLP